MDKRILMVIACFWIIASSIFVYQKVFSANRINSPVYTTSIKNNTTSVGEVNHFKDQTEGASRWKWNFGDDQYSFEKEPEHIYTEPGTYTVTLTSYGSFGHIKDDKKTITVKSGTMKSEPVAAVIIGPEILKQQTTATFSTTATAGSYEWSVSGEPQYANASLKTKDITLSFNTPGRKMIVLKLSDPEQTVSKSVEVVVEQRAATPPPPQVKKPAPVRKPSSSPAKDDDWIEAKDLK